MCAAFSWGGSFLRSRYRACVFTPVLPRDRAHWHAAGKIEFDAAPVRMLVDCRSVPSADPAEKERSDPSERVRKRVARYPTVTLVIITDLVREENGGKWRLSATMNTCLLITCCARRLQDRRACEGGVSLRGRRYCSFTATLTAAQCGRVLLRRSERAFVALRQICPVSATRKYRHITSRLSMGWHSLQHSCAPPTSKHR